VVHFRLRAFDQNGVEILIKCNPTAVLALPDLKTNDWCSFGGLTNNALPNSIELELGILEPSVVEQVRALGTNVQNEINFLTNRMGAVHIFRQQIPVRAALPR
jgi:hypothetical protein